MPKDPHNYFKHDSNAHDDIKIKAIIKKYGLEGYGRYWYLVEILREQEAYKIELSEENYESLAEGMKCETNQAKDYINYLIKVKLLLNSNNLIHSARLDRDMDFMRQLSEQNRQNVMVRYQKQKGSE